jgi:hypothetical protein
MVQHMSQARGHLFKTDRYSATRGRCPFKNVADEIGCRFHARAASPSRLSVSPGQHDGRLTTPIDGMACHEHILSEH